MESYWLDSWSNAKPTLSYCIRIFHSGRATIGNRRFICHYRHITSGTGLPLPSVSTPSETFEASHPDNPDSEQNLEHVHENPQLLPSALTNQGTELIPSSREKASMTLSDLAVSKPKQQVPRALKNLLPFNNPGLKEWLAVRREMINIYPRTALVFIIWFNIVAALVVFISCTCFLCTYISCVYVFITAWLTSLNR